MTGGETPDSRRSIDESELDFPAGASRAERVEMRLDAIEKNGRLVIERASAGAYMGRLIACILVSLLGVAALVMGADGYIALCAVAVIGIFGVWFPVVTIRRYRQDLQLELTPEAVELVRVTPSGEETVHHATWWAVDSVTMERFGNRPAAPAYPALNVAFASGSGRRAKRGSFLSGELDGERFVINQPLHVSGWELIDLLTAAHQRFK